ncbi:hypothetical protein AAG570_008617 [Ranatra chinensis]|uniref:Uncharacterized protein n=1 Tax=Ranatra chinensis TaxID=642074 RepID=A0ABD0ZER5_9HEMI
MASKRRNMFHKNKTQETTENDVIPASWWSGIRVIRRIAQLALLTSQAEGIFPTFEDYKSPNQRHEEEVTNRQDLFQYLSWERFVRLFLHVGIRLKAMLSLGRGAEEAVSCLSAGVPVFKSALICGPRNPTSPLSLRFMDRPQRCIISGVQIRENAVPLGASDFNNTQFVFYARGK